MSYSTISNLFSIFFALQTHFSVSTQQFKMSSQEQREGPTPANRPNLPEIGNFKLFWGDYKALRDAGENDKADHVISKLSVMCVGDSYYCSSLFLQIGEEIDKLLDSKTEAEKNAAEMIIEALDIRCSVLSHPWWQRFDEEQDDWPFTGFNDIKWGILGLTEGFLKQLIKGSLLTDSGSIPKHHLELMAMYKS
jgi:hypothetical protein